MLNNKNRDAGLRGDNSVFCGASSCFAGYHRRRERGNAATTDLGAGEWSFLRNLQFQISIQERDLAFIGVSAMFRLLEASRAACLSERGRTGQIDGNTGQLRVLAQIGAGKVEELITQTYIGSHATMKLAVDNVAVALQGLQMEMARLTEAMREGPLAERGKPALSLGAYKLKGRLRLVS